MKKAFSFYPGKVAVSFRKGPSGHLRQDPSDQAMELKRRPSPTFPAQSQHTVRTNALTAVEQRGGDKTDRLEVMGEYVLQFGKYKGQTFRWLLENDVGYTIYLFNKVEQEESEGTFHPEGHSKDSLLSFLEYAGAFKEIQDLQEYLKSSKPVMPVPTEGENVVGFGVRAKDTWQRIWDTRADGYAAFILSKKCIPNSRMYNLQQYLLKQQQTHQTSPSQESPHTAAGTLVMEEDEELEQEMLKLSPSAYTAPSESVSSHSTVSASATGSPRFSQRILF